MSQHAVHQSVEPPYRGAAIGGSPDRRLSFPATSPVALDKNARHRFACDHALSIYRANTIYTMIPKNACSTMRYSVALENGFLDQADGVDWIHKNNPTFRATQREIVTADYTFAILRCPYRRLASGFVDKIVDQELMLRGLLEFGMPRPTKTRWPWRNRHKRPSFDLDGITFRRFVTLLTREGALASNHHWTPQNRFLIYKHYDDLFRVEHMAELQARVWTRIRLQVHDARGLTGHGTERLTPVDDKCYADTPIGELAELKRNGKFPAYAALYDAPLIETVRHLYAEDLDLYAHHFGSDDILFR